MQLLKHGEAKVRRQAGSTLVTVVKHTGDLAQAAIAHRLFPAVLMTLQDGDAVVRKNGACVVRDVAKHSADTAGAAAAAGAIPSLIEYMTTRARGGDR
jgi:hypothetical protein